MLIDAKNVILDGFNVDDNESLHLFLPRVLDHVFIGGSSRWDRHFVLVDVTTIELD